VALMWPTWLAVHGVRRYRCAPKAACPNLVITRPHNGHWGVFMPPRSNNQLQQELTRSTTPKSFLEADTCDPTTQGLAPANDGGTHARSAFNRCVKPVASYLWSPSVCRESHCVIMRYQRTSIRIQRIAVIHPRQSICDLRTISLREKHGSSCTMAALLRINTLHHTVPNPSRQTQRCWYRTRLKMSDLTETY